MGKLSDVIDARLKELGIPGSKMCDDLSMSRSTLTELRKGRATTLKAEKAAAIASYLGLSVEELVGKEKPNNERIINDADIKAAFWGGEKDLAPEEVEELWQDVKDYVKFKTEQKRKGK